MGAHLLTVEELPSHTHGIHWHAMAIGGDVQSAAGNGYNPVNDSTDATGGNQPHSNMQPYCTVYIFKRTA